MCKIAYTNALCWVKLLSDPKSTIRTQNRYLTKQKKLRKARDLQVKALQDIFKSKIRMSLRILPQNNKSKLKRTIASCKLHSTLANWRKLGLKLRFYLLNNEKDYWRGIANNIECSCYLLKKNMSGVSILMKSKFTYTWAFNDMENYPVPGSEAPQIYQWACC